MAFTTLLMICHGVNHLDLGFSQTTWSSMGISASTLQSGKGETRVLGMTLWPKKVSPCEYKSGVEGLWGVLSCPDTKESSHTSFQSSSPNSDISSYCPLTPTSPSLTFSTPPPLYFNSSVIGNHITCLELVCILSY